MSRVGRLPIPVPDGIEVRINGAEVSIKGPKGELERSFDPDMQVSLADRLISVSRPTDEARHRALHGLTRTLIANMVQGVFQGYEKRLEIHGVGYRAK